MVWRTPDTEDNRAAFGGQSNYAQHRSPFPQLRMACLLEARARLLVDAAMGCYSSSEYAPAEQLSPQLPQESLVLVDKGIYSAGLLWPLYAYRAVCVPFAVVPLTTSPRSAAMDCTSVAKFGDLRSAAYRAEARWY